MPNKLELTWYGKDEPIRVEPRLLIENVALSNTTTDPDTENMLIHGDNLVVSSIFRKMVCRAWHERSQPAMKVSSRASSRCFMFMYFLLPHWVPATWRSRAQTSMRAELPSGKLPTTRVRRRISRFSRSMTLLVRMRVQCSLGKSQ